MGIVRSIKKRFKVIRNYIYIYIYNLNGTLSVGKNIDFQQNVKYYGKGKIIIEDSCMFGYEIGGGFYGYSEIQTRDKNAEIFIGKGCLFNNNFFICARKKITIGEYCLFGRNVTIMDHNGHGISPEERRSSSGTARDVVIGNNVWVGNYVTILPGTTIGENTIIAVGSIVQGDIPANVVVKGNPGVVVRVIKRS